MMDAGEAYGKTVLLATISVERQITTAMSQGLCEAEIYVQEPRVRAEILAELCKLGYQLDVVESDAARWHVKW